MAIDITNSMEYQAVLEKIGVLYGDKTQQIINVANTYELTPAQLADDYLRGSGFEPWYTKNGGIGGFNVSASGNINNASAVDSALNSNTGVTTMTTVKAPVETVVNQSGKVDISGGLTKVATGAKSTLQFVSQEVLPAVAATGLGISLGKAIDSALYNANPDFWDNNGMSSLNPETWNSITSDYPDGILKRAFNAIFGLDPTTGSGQMYIDADAAAYLARYMAEQDIFAAAQRGVTWPDDLTNPPDLGYYNPPLPLCGGLTFQPNGANYPSSIFVFYGPTVAIRSPLTNGKFTYITVVENSGDLAATQRRYNSRTGVEDTPIDYHANQSYTMDGKTVYYATNNITGLAPIVAGGDSVVQVNVDSHAPNKGPIAWMLKYGKVTGGETVPGVTDQTGANIPNFDHCTTPQDYLDEMRRVNPGMFDNAVSQTTVNPDGTTTTRTYLPIGTPSGGNTTQPTTNPTNNPSGQTQTASGVDPNGSTTNLLNDLIKLITQTVPKPGQETPTDTGNPDPTGTGTTPPVVTPTGQASALFAVYNPSQAALNSFGAWLWSSNFIDQVLKLFNNPMQSIIGLHKIFAAPPISGSGTIRVGYLDSGVGSNLVGGQYVTVNCGTVKVSEQFGNVFDYTDTHVRLYLPFIGIVPLDTADVMRGSVSVVYHVDVITGACLAEVKITRDGGGGTLYQYAGDAAVRYPISSGSYMGVVSGVLGVVGGIASAVMTGGASAPLAAGAVASGIANAKTDVQHSGSFAGNAGAMGGKKPYLIIERPQTSIASGFSAYQGVGANTVKKVGSMSGYFKMTDVHVESVARASAEEMEQIRTMIESGVIK